jgi:pyridoxal phosphate enzyme (YggS family)
MEKHLDLAVRGQKSGIENLRSDIKDICSKAGRDPDEVTIIAASKYTGAQGITEALGFGIMDFGENRADALTEKFTIIGNKVTWHFIGHLQSRKAKAVVCVAEYIHSCDSLDIMKEINKQAAAICKVQKILIEVNISGEESKYGLQPQGLPGLIRNALEFKNISVCGLMTMAPLCDDQILIRKVFKGLRQLRDKTVLEIRDHADNFNLSELSMGMSNDYKIAIEEGATMVRIGSLIFS